MTDVDFDRLQADAAPVTVPLLAGKTLHDEVFTSGPLTGFAVLDAAQVIVKIGSVRGAGTRSLVLTVEGSDDGDTWAPLDGCEFEFTHNGAARASVAEPPDQLRVTCTPGETMSGGFVSSVTVAPLYLNKRAG